MREKGNFHRPFGVYGINIDSDRLLVIHKNRGPYANRFDLPGGSLEPGESLTSAMKREYLEETGLEIEIVDQIGTTDFMFPCKWREYTHIHHIAVFYAVRKVGGEISEPEQFEGQDSLGAEWVKCDELTIHNSSPLVLKAVEWMQTGKLDVNVTWYEKWVVKKQI